MKEFIFISIIVLALLIPASVYVNAAIPDTTARAYPVIGSHVGTVNGSIGEVIDMHGMSTLTWILNLTGSNLFYNSTTLTVQVNQEGGGSDWLTAGTIDLGNVSSATMKTRTFSSDNHTGFNFNPAGFPFVRLSTSAGIIGSIETLYWTGTLR